MPKAKSSRLADSWIVNDVVDNIDDDDDDDISWKDESGRSSPDDSSERRKVVAAAEPSLSSSLSSSSPSRTSPTLPPNRSGPGFVFPTIDSPTKSRHVKSTTPSSQLRKRQQQQQQQRATPSPRSSGRTTKPKAVHIHTIPSAGHDNFDSIASILRSALDYVLSILKVIFLLLRQPIAILLAVYLFAGILALSYSLLTSSITTALSPLCRLPLSSMFRVCTSYAHFSADQPPSLSDGPGHADPEFDALMATHDQLSDILGSTSAAVSLPLDMKRSETSIRDLRQIVRFSSLPARNELVFEFDGFIETARTASYDLQKFNSHVGRAIDIVLSTARWTERILDDMAVQEQRRENASTLASYLGRLLSPFNAATSTTGFTQARLLETYIAHTRIISDQLGDLITQASALLMTLQSLEDRLDVMHAIALQSQHDTQLSRADTLSHLWTVLGGNRAHLARYESQLRLLRQVGEYRRLAWAHVSATLVKLQAMQAELEELRERVGSAEAEVAAVGPPRAATDRTPLAVHLHVIRLGVERLEGERERARSVQRGEVAKAMNAAATGRNRIDA